MEPTDTPDFYLLALIGLSLAAGAALGITGGIARLRAWLTARRLREPFAPAAPLWGRRDPRDWQGHFHDDLRRQR